MIVVSDVLSVFEDFAPTRWTKQIYPGDNVGLLVGRKDAPAEHVLVALDVTEAVIDEALCRGASLVVTHHPVTFGLKAVTDETPDGRLMLKLIENRVAAICMHTNWDAAPGGINDLLARAVGLTGPLRMLGQEYTDQDGRRYALGRVGELAEPMTAGALAEQVKHSLRGHGVRYVDGGRPCRCIAVGSGSSGSQWADVLRHGCDTFVTGDVKHNLFLEAVQFGVTLIDAGHFPTEQVIVKPMADYLQKVMPALTVLTSEAAEEPAVWLV